MSLGAGAYKVGGARQGIHGNPVSKPPPGTVTLNNSAEYLPTNTNLAWSYRGREG